MRFRLSLTLTSTLDAYHQETADFDAKRLFLLIEPEEAGYLVLGPAVDLLEAEHPRLPATFFAMFTGALNRWVRVYDHRDAEERVEMLREWWEADPEAENVELPDVAGSVPALMRQPPLTVRGLRRVQSSLRNPLVKRLVEGVLDLHQLSESRQRPHVSDEVGEQLMDCNPPVPALVAVFRSRDAIEGVFDDESQGMLECPPEPNLILPLDATDPASIRDMHRTLGTVCEVLAGASRLMDRMPGNDLGGDDQ